MPHTRGFLQLLHVSNAGTGASSGSGRGPEPALHQNRGARDQRAQAVALGLTSDQAGVRESTTPARKTPRRRWVVSRGDEDRELQAPARLAGDTCSICDSRCYAHLGPSSSAATLLPDGNLHTQGCPAGAVT